ncbi:MAG: hypothetical protein LRY63_02015 [Nitrincola sp.]|nr:hypothetical protein [Nitrincola sp.]
MKQRRVIVLISGLLVGAAIAYWLNPLLGVLVATVLFSVDSFLETRSAKDNQVIQAASKKETSQYINDDLQAIGLSVEEVVSDNGQ